MIDEHFSLQLLSIRQEANTVVSFQRKVFGFS